MLADGEEESGTYSRFGIPDAPKTTRTTLFGKTKTCVGLLYWERIFLALSILNILAALGLTLYRLVKVADTDPNNSDLTFTILIIVNALFTAFYAIHGVVRERKYELYVQVLAILIILVYCIVEYSIYSEKRTTVKLVRLILACVLAPPNICLAIYVARDFGELEFRIAGASENLQHVYNQAAIFSSLLKFDLQVTVSFVILALKDGIDLKTIEIVTLAVGIPYTLLWVIIGWLVLRMELKWGAWLFAFLGLAKPAYYIYKIVKLYQALTSSTPDPDPIIVYCLLIGGGLAMITWILLNAELVIVYRNYGKGLKERVGVNFGIPGIRRRQAVEREIVET